MHLSSFVPASAMAVALYFLGTPNICAQQGPAPIAPDARFAAPAPLVELQDGDVFVFLGDSITHQALYTQYVEDFFLTRYPEREITFHNAGVNGDRAADALERFERDVAAYRPDHVSVLLGMNDASYTAWRSEAFELYVRDMSQLIERLEAIGAGITLMHPTMFDARAVRLQGPAGEPTASLYNGALAYYGEWCRELALQRGLGFADLHAPLNRLTFDRRREDPRFTLIPDGVHPGPNGQAVMAVTMLEETFVRARLVGNVTLAIDAEGRHQPSAPGATLSEFVENENDGSFEFTYLAASLPWVLPEEARLGYELTRAGHRLSGERFAARGLAPGEWELLIDGKAVGSWSHDRLARGIELQDNEKTPQYQQALAVAAANRERNQLYVKSLRDWWGQRKGLAFELRKAAAENPGDSARIAKQKQAYQSWLETQFETGVTQAENEAKAAWASLRELSQPKPHRYRLQRVTP